MGIKAVLSNNRRKVGKAYAVVGGQRRKVTKVYAVKDGQRKLVWIGATPIVLNGNNVTLSGTKTLYDAIGRGEDFWIMNGATGAIHFKLSIPAPMGIGTWENARVDVNYSSTSTGAYVNKIGVATTASGTPSNYVNLGNDDYKENLTFNIDTNPLTLYLHIECSRVGGDGTWSEVDINSLTINGIPIHLIYESHNS